MHMTFMKYITKSPHNQGTPKPGAKGSLEMGKSETVDFFTLLFFARTWHCRRANYGF
jgi:hypothetical protein